MYTRVGRRMQSETPRTPPRQGVLAACDGLLVNVLSPVHLVLECREQLDEVRQLDAQALSLKWCHVCSSDGFV